MADNIKPPKKFRLAEALLLVAIPLSNIAYQYLAKTIAFDAGFGHFSLATIWALTGNFKFWLMVVCEAFSLIMWLKILSDMDLAKAFPITALAYVVIIFISVAAFKEKLHWNDLVGSLLILGGILTLLSIESKNDA